MRKERKDEKRKKEKEEGKKEPLIVFGFDI